MSLFHVARLLLVLIAGLQQSTPVITAPVQGQRLQGSIEITGSLDPTGFSSAELSFSYASDPTGTWFLLATISEPVQAGQLAAWDTSLVTDGDYRLRLRQFRDDGTTADFFVEELHISNRVQEATATLPATKELPSATEPGDILLLATPQPAVAATVASLPTVAAARPTAQSFQPNPASITTQHVFSMFARGGLLALILFIVLGAFLHLRHR